MNSHQYLASYSVSEAEDIVIKSFGINGCATRLPGGYDFNFHIKCEDGKQFLLKISHANEEKSIIEMQNAALQGLNSSPRPFNFPKPQQTLTGEFIAALDTDSGQSHFARLLTYVQGTLLANMPPSLELLQSFGEKLGQLSLALNQFHHPAAKRVFNWDLLQASSIEERIPAIENKQDRQCVETIYKYYKNNVLPKLSELRFSIIHNDANPWNVLVTTPMFGKPQVSGFIDFGDMVESSTICELAIAVTYAIMGNSNPLHAAAEIIKNYHAVYPLLQDEIEILFDLICIRLCVSVVNSAIRKDNQSDNDALSISEKPAWDLLRKLSNVDSLSATTIFKKACQLNECNRFLTL